MGGVIPFYVREFNAASMAEAIHVADQAFREDGVTVAVWINRLANLDQTELQNREKCILGFKQACQLGDKNITTAKYDQKFSGISFHSEYESGSPESRFNPFQDDEILSLTLCFAEVSGALRYEEAETINIAPHQDYGRAFQGEFDMREDNIFYGVDARYIERFEGSPTIFYANYKEENPYELPSQAAAFFLTNEYSEKAAIHSASYKPDDKRVLLVLDLVAFR